MVGQDSPGLNKGEGVDLTWILNRIATRYGITPIGLTQNLKPIETSKVIMQRLFSTAEVADMAGIRRDTLIQWLRKRIVPEPQRNRHSWRAFTAGEADAIVAYARRAEPNTTPATQHGDETTITRLERINWDFASARTGYLTHNLHPYPAKFIPQIPNTLIQELSSVGETIADLFCGSGTTLLEAIQLRRHAIGIDANPLAALISRTKTTPLSDPEFEELSAHQAACQQALEKMVSRTGDLFYSGQPFRSPGWRPSPKICDFWFEPHVVEELSELRLLIDRIQSQTARELCQVAFAAIIVAVSKQDSDTRYVRREKSIEPGDAVRRYLDQIKTAVSAVREMSDLIEDRFSCHVLCANILDAPETAPFDLVVTSPPYPNAYSYHLYHRIRLAWLGHDPERFKRIEIGSHRKFSAKGSSRATPETFRKEFESIFQWLRGRLRDHRHACFVIGDSVVNREHVDNASIISAAGTCVGFREVARIKRTIASTRKAFNPKIGRIQKEHILILQKV